MIENGGAPAPTPRPDYSIYDLATDMATARQVLVKSARRVPLSARGHAQILFVDL